MACCINTEHARAQIDRSDLGKIIKHNVPPVSYRSIELTEKVEYLYHQFHIYRLAEEGVTQYWVEDRLVEIVALIKSKKQLEISKEKIEILSETEAPKNAVLICIIKEQIRIKRKKSEERDKTTTFYELLHENYDVEFKKDSDDDVAKVINQILARIRYEKNTQIEAKKIKEFIGNYRLKLAENKF